MKRNWTVRILSALFAAACFVFACSILSGCSIMRTAPRSVEQLAEMPEDRWQAWLGGVEAWSAAAGEGAIALGAKLEEVERFTAELAKIEKPEGPWILELAKATGLPPTVAALIGVEGQALLDARGGLPAGARALEALGRIASAVRAGARAAAFDDASKAAAGGAPEIVAPSEPAP